MKHRSAQTGRAVTPEVAKAHPDTTIKHSKSKDTKRLDWLQKNQAHLQVSTMREGQWLCVTESATRYYGRSVRAAIDEAMNEQRKAKTSG